MTDYGTAVFETPATDIGTGTAETFTFEFSHDLRQDYESVADYLLKGGSNVVAVLSDSLDFLDGGNKQDIRINQGAGQHIIRVEATVAKGSPNTWGTGDGDPVTDATGEHPVKQIQLLDRVIQKTNFDSTTFGRLEVGEYSSGGPWERPKVVPLKPNFVFDAERESSTATVSLGFLEVAALEEPIDAQDRTPE